MQFASFTFLFFFLPITMGIYYLTPRRWKQEVMLGISILFLFCGGWMAALTELVLAALTYGAGLLLEKLRTKKALSRLTLAGTLLVQFGALIVLRSDWLYSLKAGAFHGSALFPLGLAFSFCRMQATALMCSVASAVARQTGAGWDCTYCFIPV